MMKISVIVPIYNSERNLKRCITSIITQTYSNIEIILVNDGSKDQSLTICKQFAAKDKRIKVIDKENEGVAIARNVGLDNATGHFVSFIDSDDYIDKRMYEELIKFQQDNNADIVEYGYRLVYDNKPSLQISFEQTPVIRKVEYLISLIEQNNTAAAVWNKFYRKSLIENIRFPDLSYSEDLFFNIEISLKDNYRYTIEKTYYNYYQNDAGAKKSNFTKQKLDDINSREKIIELIEQQPEEYLKVIPYVYRDILKRVIILYIDMEKTNITDKKSLRKYLINKFFEYYELVSKEAISSIESVKYRILIKLFGKSPTLFQRLLSLYLKIN